MIGRLIDQLLPAHVQCEEEARIVSRFRSDAYLGSSAYTHKAPWGNTLPLWHAGDLNIANLETALTTHETKWPDKVFNYRCHPENIRCLQEAKIDAVNLANNHSLDFCEEGLVETIQTLQTSGIQFTGATQSKTDESMIPTLLNLPRQDSEEHNIHILGVSDHPSDWAAVPNFNLIHYTAGSRQRLKEAFTTSLEPSLKIVTIHWGPNYSWSPSPSIRSLAHFLVDECDVDIVHGHSSHHVQGVETYKGKLIIYGCGDFVDDYAVKREFRNDLSALWRVTVTANDGCDNGKRLKVKRLEVFPTRCQLFRTNLLTEGDEDHRWVVDKVKELSQHLGTEAQDKLGDDGQLVFEI
jgi:poly-gamma-glutamate capsule biosynthesis protein CapA/YwtB (metallophosphatase superfamily)